MHVWYVVVFGFPARGSFSLFWVPHGKVAMLKHRRVGHGEPWTRWPSSPDVRGQIQVGCPGSGFNGAAELQFCIGWLAASLHTLCGICQSRHFFKDVVCVRARVCS
eukprot:jgi/Ulvmu1/7737/UM039_0045.1